MTGCRHPTQYSGALTEERCTHDIKSKTAKIAYTGGGKDLEQAHKPAILARNGVRVATLSYTWVYPHVGFAAEDNKPGLATVKIHTSYQAPENVFYQPGYPPLTTTLPDPAE